MDVTVNDRAEIRISQELAAQMEVECVVEEDGFHWLRWRQRGTIEWHSRWLDKAPQFTVGGFTVNGH